MHVAAARQLIERRYATVHGAVPETDYPHFCIVGDRRTGPGAVLGFRLAAFERLFLETYLDDPIEHVVSQVLNMPVSRGRIVEIGSHASERSRATVALWAQTARHLDGLADVAVAVLTEPLRNMFARLGIGISEICDADPRRLPEGSADWGRYYEQKPRVCAGIIAPALPKLAGFDTSMSGVCA
jgi:hypothetical protein